MNLLTLDFETYYDSEYTLKKLTTEAYVRDPRFEALCCGLKFNDTEVDWCSGDLRYVFEQIDWSKTAVLCHHAHFDGLILSHHYGIKPAFWFDTLSMARLLFGNAVSASLGSLVERLGLGEKSIDYQSFKGRHWADMSPAEQQALGDGCACDVELTHAIFKILLPKMPRQELDLIDLTVRMFTEPCIEGDVAALEACATAERERKQKALDELGVRKTELASATQFAAILTGLGVEVEYKTTPKGNSIPAVAATDDFMKGLLEDDNEVVAALAGARLDAGSSIDETRSDRLAGIARRGKLPVYLSYCAAHTLRWGGGDRVNFQNFRRGGEIRKAIRAPAGCLLLIVDASQIECRFLEWVAGEQEALEDWRNGVDPYIKIASKFYGRSITKADKAERGTGKQIVLSCGYGAGGDSIVRTAKRGAYGPPVILSADQGVAARDLYRQSRPGVVRFWKVGDQALGIIAGPKIDTEWRIFNVHANGDGSGWIEGPGGVRMLYTLEWDEAERSWRRKTRQGWRKIWGGVVTQNLIELVSRCYLGDVMINVRNSFPALKLAWCTHDELVYVVRDDGDAPHYLQHVLGMMRRAPSWASDIPLDAEGVLSKVYEK